MTPERRGQDYASNFGNAPGAIAHAGAPVSDTSFHAVLAEGAGGAGKGTDRFIAGSII